MNSSIGEQSCINNINISKQNLHEFVNSLYLLFIILVHGM